MKKILVTRSSMPPLEEYVDEIRDLWESHFLTNMGEKHKRLQAALEKYLGVEHVELLVNGHMALEMSLQAFDFGGGGKTKLSPRHSLLHHQLMRSFETISNRSFAISSRTISRSTYLRSNR